MRRSLMIALMVAAATMTLPGCVIIPFGSFSPELREVTIRPGGWFASKVAVIDVDGVISSRGGGMFGPANLVSEIDEELKLIEHDGSVKAVVLRVNSPGGGVTASDLLYRRLSQFREKRNIPVYASMMDMAASGGYYVSMAADKVFASPTTVTGSIGVIAVFPEGESLLSKIGLNFSVIKSGDFKDIGSLFRHMKPEERELLQKVVLSMYDRFVEVVSKGRPNLTEDRIRELADGRIYTAEQAHASGLVDGIAYIDEVVEKVEVEAGIRHARIVTYRRWSSGGASLFAQTPQQDYSAGGSGWLNSLRGNSPPSNTQINLLNVGDSPTRGDMHSYFHYLWVP